MATSEKKLLNPKAVEFRPCSVNSPPFFPNPAESPVFHHLPQYAPPPPPHPELVNLYPQLQPQPMMYYYPHNQMNQFNHYHIHPPSTFMSTQNYFFPRPDPMLLKTDDGLGLITSPTSPTSPLEFPSTNSVPKVYRKRFNRKSNLGRVQRPTPEIGNSSSSKIKIWARKSETPDEANPNPDAPLPLPLAAYPFRDCTSLMIRNIPVRLRRTQLMWLLDEHCFQENAKLGSGSDAEPRSEFDYLYLPIDFKSRGNLGYAFVNFTTWQGASRLYNSWKGTTWDKCSYRTKKICQIYPAKFQGVELKKHLERSMYQCESDEYLPVEINPPRDGSNTEATKVTTLGTRLSSTLTLGL